MAKKTKKPSPPQFAPGAGEALRRLILLRENAEYREFFDKYGKLYKDAREMIAAAYLAKDHPKIGEGMAFLMEFKQSLRDLFGVNASSDLLDHYFHLLDPNQKIGAIKGAEYELAIERMFWEPPITQVWPLKNMDSTSVYPPECLTIALRGSRWIGPNERILRVDLRADKTTLMERFRAYLDYVEMVKASDPGKFDAWWPDQTREKKRYKRDVDIWRLHCEGMSSAEIGRRLQIPRRTVLDAFHKKYEEVEGKPFKRGTFRRKYLKKTR